MIRRNTTKILLCKNNFSNFLKQNMSKKLKEKKSASATENDKNKPTNSTQKETGPITLDKSNNVLLQIYAKPGAKQNKITGITAEGVNVQINAPPTEGAANTELVKFIASVLELPKSNVSLERGHKSRLKLLKIKGNQLDAVSQKIKKEIDEGG